MNAWNYLSTNGAELVAVCDTDSKKAKLAGERFNVRWFSELDQMLSEVSIDLLDVVTQMSARPLIARTAARHQIAAILQKPLASDLRQCIEIVETAKKSNSWLAVHENFRFGTGMRRVQEVIKSGEIGVPNWERISFRTGFDVYAGQPYLANEARGVILDSGIHMIDLARFFFGEVKHVFCETQKRNPSIKGEDTATIMLRHTSGSVSLVESTYEAKRIPDAFPETFIEIEGTKGSVVVSKGEEMTVTSQNSSRTEFVGSPLLPWTAKPWHISQEAVLNTNKHMLETFREGREADTSGLDNLKTFSLVEASYLSSKTRKAIVPKYS